MFELTPAERNTYYLAVCNSLGLNPLTRPLEYITLQGRMILYARRDATDQLRSIHEVAIEDMVESEIDGVYIVTVKARNAVGRTDMAKGATNIGGLKGEALANAMMKAETKAKRRVTLSLCGLGSLDETEALDVTDGGGEKIDEKQLAALVKLAGEVGADIGRFCKHFKIEDMAGLPLARLVEASALLEAKRK